MSKFTVKLPRMTGQQVMVMCHLALGSRITRHQTRATPPRYEYPLSWVLGNGYWKRHGKVSAKTINALVKKDMVRMRKGEIRATKKVLGIVMAQHDEKFQQVREAWKCLNEIRQEDRAEKKAEAQARHENDTEGDPPDRDDSELVMSDTENYNALANRLMGAFNEVNVALQEAFALDTMTVSVEGSPLTEGGPRQYHPRIYRLTHAEMQWKVKIKARLGGESSWMGAERVAVQGEQTP